MFRSLPFKFPGGNRIFFFFMLFQVSQHNHTYHPIIPGHIYSTNLIIIKGIIFHSPLPQPWFSAAANDCPSPAPLLIHTVPVHLTAVLPEELWSPAAPHTAAAAPAGGATHRQRWNDIIISGDVIMSKRWATSSFTSQPLPPTYPHRSTLHVVLTYWRVSTAKFLER